MLLYGMAESGSYTSMQLLVIASAGNTLGGVFTYSIGLLLFRGLSHVAWGRRVQQLFRLEDKALERVRHWGVPCLLLSWMPVIGDPLCLAAGYLGLKFWPSASMIAIGKFLRYLVLLWLFGWS